MVLRHKILESMKRKIYEVLLQFPQHDTYNFSGGGVM